MPSGAGSGGRFLFSTVGGNGADAGVSAAGGLERIVVKARTTAPVIGTTAIAAHALLLRRRTDTVLIGLERRLLMDASILAAVPLCAGEKNYAIRYPKNYPVVRST